MLGIIGILVLIYQDIAETLHIFLTNILMRLEQLIRQHQQIIKIHGICLSATLHIDIIDAMQFEATALLVTQHQLGIRCITLRWNEMVLRIAYHGMYASGLVDFIIQLHFLDNGFEQRPRVGLIVNRKARPIAYLCSLWPQYPCEDRVESAHVDVACCLMSHQLSNALFHLVGGFIGKGECQDVPRFHALLYLIGYLISQDTCLSRPCSCDDQLRTVVVGHGSLLTLVQLS